MGKKILIVTCSDEPNIKRVTRFIPEELYVRLNTDELLNQEFGFFLDAKGSFNCGFVSQSMNIDLRDVGAVWYRRPILPRASEELSESDKGFTVNEAQKFLRSLWSVFGLVENNLFWMNHPVLLHELEFNKPLQCHFAAKVGLKVPETLITNDLSLLRAFFDTWNGQIIHKTFGGYVTRDEDGSDLAIYTCRVSEESLVLFGSELKYSPAMFQNYIPKKLELRITIVGDNFLSCAIHSQDSDRTKDDWRRYDFDKVRHEPYDLPDEIKSKLKALMRKLGLTFGAIDMILTLDGDYVFLEINPSGQWAWIESLTGLPISESIANTLLNKI